MSRRRRCTGPCGDLFPAERLAKVGGRSELCPDCLLLEANDLAPTDPVRSATDPVRTDARKPEPLELRDEDERFEGLIEYAVEGWPLRRGRLSASSIATYMRCPEQFRREKVLGQKRPSNGSGLIGTGAHGAIEAALRLRIEHEKDASPEQIADTFDVVFDSAVFRADQREGVNWGNAEKKPLDLNRARRIGRDAVASYAASDAYRLLEPQRLEHVFAFTIPGVPVPFCGLIDVLTRQGAPIDLKFGDRCLSVMDPGWRVQAQVYGMAARQSPAFHSISWAGKVQSPAEAPGLRMEWDARQTILAARQLRFVVGAILRDARELGPEGPWLGNTTHTWACGACAFREECAWWNVDAEDLLV